MSKSSDSRVDVLIVGARCAGSATATFLARAGLRVRVIDRAREGTDTLSTHALMRGGVRQLARLGVLDVIAARTPATCHSLASRYSRIASAARNERLRPVLSARASSRSF